MRERLTGNGNEKGIDTFDAPPEGTPAPTAPQVLVAPRADTADRVGPPSDEVDAIAGLLDALLSPYSSAPHDHAYIAGRIITRLDECRAALLPEASPDARSDAIRRAALEFCDALNVAHAETERPCESCASDARRIIDAYERAAAGPGEPEARAQDSAFLPQPPSICPHATMCGDVCMDCGLQLGEPEALGEWYEDDETGQLAWREAEP